MLLCSEVKRCSSIFPSVAWFSSLDLQPVFKSLIPSIKEARAFDYQFGVIAEVGVEEDSDHWVLIGWVWSELLTLVIGFHRSGSFTGRDGLKSNYHH